MAKASGVHFLIDAPFSLKHCHEATNNKAKQNKPEPPFIVLHNEISRMFLGKSGVLSRNPELISIFI